MAGHSSGTRQVPCRGWGSRWIPMALDACEVGDASTDTSFKVRLLRASREDGVDRTNECSGLPKLCSVVFSLSSVFLLTCAFSMPGVSWSLAPSQPLTRDKTNIFYRPVCCLLLLTGSEEHDLMSERFRVQRPRAVFCLAPL